MSESEHGPYPERAFGLCSKTVSVPLALGRFSARLEDLPKVCCLDCHVPLDLHQPDTGLPERLLGVCSGCGRWHLLDVIADTDEALLVLLPDPPYFANALGT